MSGEGQTPVKAKRPCEDKTSNSRPILSPLDDPPVNVSDFLETHFRHFNARELLAAARSYREIVRDGGKMMHWPVR